jgi:hypothetical protein
MAPEASLQNRGKRDLRVRRGPPFSLGGRSPRQSNPAPAAPGPAGGTGGPSGPRAHCGLVARARHLHEKAARAPNPPEWTGPVLHPSAHPRELKQTRIPRPEAQFSSTRAHTRRPPTKTPAALAPPISWRLGQSEPSPLRSPAPSAFQFVKETEVQGERVKIGSFNSCLAAARARLRRTCECAHNVHTPIWFLSYLKRNVKRAN